MHTDKLQQYRKEIINFILSHKDKIEDFATYKDNSIVVFTGENYACEINLSDKWFGIDLGVFENVSESEIGGIDENDDGYGTAEIWEELYREIVVTLEALFAGRISYMASPQHIYIVRKNSNNTYYVHHSELKKFLGIKYSTASLDGEMSQPDFEAMNIKSLKILK